MKHISYISFRGRHDDGKFIMPVEMHETYCRKVVRGFEIDNVNPTCEECMDCKVWEEIDARTENEARMETSQR